MPPDGSGSCYKYHNQCQYRLRKAHNHVKVIEGKAQIGAGNAAGVGTPAGRGAHQYLDQMQNRGGGYAILCAFHFHAAPGETLMIDEICRRAQPYCNEEMRPTYFNPGARG